MRRGSFWDELKKAAVWALTIVVILSIVFSIYHHLDLISYKSIIKPLFTAENTCQIPDIITPRDINNNGIYDQLDIINGARQEVINGTEYDGSYCENGYPPREKGVCTDVIWRALKEAGYDLKAMVDKDIRENPGLYGLTGQNPDPNIDFRRVQNLQVFFKRHAKELPIEVKPGDEENLKYWQAGDIVVFDHPLEHIAIISDKRSPSGVPMIIHNAGPKATENNALLQWPSRIIGHFRFEPESFIKV